MTPRPAHCLPYRFYFACIMRCIGFCHYYQGEHNNSEKPEEREKTKHLNIEKRWGRGGSMLKRELCSPRNKKNGEGKQKPEKSRKWEHLTLCYTSRTWVQVFHTELISSLMSLYGMYLYFRTLCLPILWSLDPSLPSSWGTSINLYKVNACMDTSTLPCNAHRVGQNHICLVYIRCFAGESPNIRCIDSVLANPNHTSEAGKLCVCTSFWLDKKTSTQQQHCQ